MMKMKKLLLVIITVIFILTSCSAPKQAKINSKADYVFGQDNQYMYSDIYGSPLQKTDNGYVYYHSGFLYFVNTKSSKATPLCDKPDCLHENDNERCRAYIGAIEGVKGSIQYYNGGIYYPIEITDTKTNETKIYIRRYDVNSLSVKDACELDRNVSDGFIVHRGFAYVELYKQADENGELNEVELCKIDLNGNKKPRMLFDFNKKGLALLSAKNLQAYGNYVYFDAECVKSGTDLSDADNDSFSQRRYGYNIESGKLTDITKNAKGNEPYFLGFYKGKILYISGEDRIYQAEPDGTNSSVLFSYKKKYNGCSVFTDEKYFYFTDRENDGLTCNVFSPKGKLLNKVKLPFAVDTNTPYDKEYIIRLVNDCKLKMIDKSKIAEKKRLKDKQLYTFKIINR